MRTREENLRILRDTCQEIAPGQKYVVDDFRPEDAEGIARLYYAVYGDRFPVDVVYDPDMIRQGYEDQATYYVVGRTACGGVVGLYSVFRGPPGRFIMEAGGWTVLPEYRNGLLAMRLAERVHRRPLSRFHLNAMFGQMVCDHVVSQKMGVKFKGFFSAIEVEAMPPRPEDGPEAGGGRISLLDGFYFYRDAPHAVHLPGRYSGILKTLYEASGLTREFREDAGTDVPAEFQVERMEKASLVKMTARSLDRDFRERLQAGERGAGDAHVFQLFLPLSLPGTTQAVEAARSLGYYLGGLLPLWDDRDFLLMQKTRGVPDFSRIQLYPAQAKRLLQAIIADRESLLA